MTILSLRAVFLQIKLPCCPSLKTTSRRIRVAPEKPCSFESIGLSLTVAILPMFKMQESLSAYLFSSQFSLIIICPLFAKYFFISARIFLYHYRKFGHQSSKIHCYFKSLNRQKVSIGKGLRIFMFFSNTIFIIAHFCIIYKVYFILRWEIMRRKNKIIISPPRRI